MAKTNVWGQNRIKISPVALDISKILTYYGRGRRLFYPSQQVQTDSDSMSGEIRSHVRRGGGGHIVCVSPAMANLRVRSG